VSVYQTAHADVFLCLRQNKNKSSKVQKYVQQVQKSVQPQKQNAEPSRKDKKKAEEEHQKELAALFAMAIKQPKVPPGVDPKSVVCEYFRHGQCTKGFKCKYSHDLNVERKGPKVDIYSDKRDADEEQEAGMDDWDQDTLEKAIAQKHGAENKNRPTEIVCRYFIDAVEKRQYGWFWQCPNGKDCKYRHALPPGYVLKSQMKALLEEEAANAKTIEEEVEEERAKVDAKTPITEEVFKNWKAENDAARLKKDQEKEEERRRKGVLTGREIFALEGFVAQDDASASDVYHREVDDEQMIKKMHEEAAAALERARSGQNGAVGEPAGSQTASAAGSAVQLTAQEEAELFDDDIEDEDEMLEAMTSELGALAT
jgi:hypothetical protein